MSKHLAIFVGDYIEKILKGEKTIESRLSKDKIAPYCKINKGDEILLKQSGGLIIGKVEVDNVLYYENLNPETIAKLRKEYNSEILAEEKYWSDRANCRYASLIFLIKPNRFLTPLKSKKHDRRAWVVLEND